MKKFFERYLLGFSLAGARPSPSTDEIMSEYLQ